MNEIFCRLATVLLVRTLLKHNMMTARIVKSQVLEMPHAKKKIKKHGVSERIFLEMEIN